MRLYLLTPRMGLACPIEQLQDAPIVVGQQQALDDRGVRIGSPDDIGGQNRAGGLLRHANQGTRE
jgi:hypothetical protein